MVFAVACVRCGEVVELFGDVVSLVLFWTLLHQRWESMVIFFIHSNYKLSRPLVIMSGKMKIGSAMMRCYDSTGDVVVWLKKAKLVAKLMEIKDIASFISLYLEGNALALYL